MWCECSCAEIMYCHVGCFVKGPRDKKEEEEEVEAGVMLVIDGEERVL